MFFISKYFIALMKILELCPFSAGVCGVWSRVFEESKRLSNLGNEVLVFSSDRVKGNDEIAESEDKIGKVKIKRFSATHLGGESFMKWNFEKEALEYSPDVIIAHNYRQLHTTKALKVAEELKSQGKNCRVFLVTHAPFVEGNITRSFAAKIAVGFYDRFIGPRTLNKFEKILAISKWEIPFLVELGASEDKIEYLPNGIPEEFFRQKRAKEENKILFLGRISHIKSLETLIEAMNLIENKSVKLEIVGPAEKDYLDYLKNLVKKFKLEERIVFSEPIFAVSEKIKKIDSAKIFVLPSRKEGMPQSLIETMAREKIVIGSNNIAIKDLIKDGENGLLFEFNTPKDLASKIDLALSLKDKKLQKNARKFVEEFSWDKVIKKLEKILKFK